MNPRQSGSTLSNAFSEIRWDTPQKAKLFFSLADDPKFRGAREGAVLLPPVTQSASTVAHSAGSVYQVYGNALMTGDPLESMSTGVLAAAGIAGMAASLACGGVMLRAIPGSDDAVFLDLILGFLAVVGIGFIFPFALSALRTDITGYRHGGTIFNRATGKIHVFRDKTKFWAPWPIWSNGRWYPNARLRALWPFWGGGACDIKTYDWRQLRPQIVLIRQYNRTTTYQDSVLSILVFDQEVSGKVIDSIGLGFPAGQYNIQPLLDCWEHVRRFMQCEGPQFGPDDAPNPNMGMETWPESLFVGQYLLGPGSLACWSGKRGLWRPLVGVLTLPFLPLTMLFGLIRGACYHLRSEPRWPREILDTLGDGPLSLEQIRVLQNCLPEAAAG